MKEPQLINVLRMFGRLVAAVMSIVVVAGVFAIVLSRGSILP